jgi:hypothetical protein
MNTQAAMIIASNKTSISAKRIVKLSFVRDKVTLSSQGLANLVAVFVIAFADMSSPGLTR